MSTPNVGSTFIVTSDMLKEHNLQALVELNYVRTGNEVMNGALSKLGQALSVTQDALVALTDVQDLHNQIAIPPATSFPFNFTATSQTLIVNSTTTFTSVPTFTATGTIGGTTTGTITVILPVVLTLNTTNTVVFSATSIESYISAYQKLASTYYGQPIAPVFHVSLPARNGHLAVSGDVTSSTGAAFLAFKTDLLQTRALISAQLAQLALTTPPGDPTSLLSRLQIVYNEMPSATASFSTFRNWVLDSYGSKTGSGVTKQGIFQQNITNAITAAESLNTSQGEAVRRYMFVFEQYIQSAAAILNQLNTLFDKISRGIAG